MAPGCRTEQPGGSASLQAEAVKPGGKRQRQWGTGGWLRGGRGQVIVHTVSAHAGGHQGATRGVRHDLKAP